MTRKLSQVALLSTLALCLASSSAWGWEAQARESIAIMSMQVIKPNHPTFFRPQDSTVSFEKDVIQGAIDGAAALNGRAAYTSPEELMHVIDTQIELLRDVRPYVPTSYYAYRMGVLAAMTADLILPFGVPQNEAQRAMGRTVNNDIEKHVEQLRFSAPETERAFVIDAVAYLTKLRRFNEDDRSLITSDYRAGIGYDGYLGQSADIYFTRAVEAVADIWNTVLDTGKSRGRAATPRNELAWYFVDEIDYLLNTKNNVFLANRVYRNFEQVSEELPDPYEKLGDLYYHFGGEGGVERGVREWRIAHSLAGPTRSRIARKLSTHYMELGTRLLRDAEEPGADDLVLPSALNAFTEALNFDRNSVEAEQHIQLTHRLIQERKARFDENYKLLGRAQETMKKAAADKEAGGYKAAINGFRAAASIFESVSDEFTELYTTAQEGMRDANNGVEDTMGTVIDTADGKISDGEAAVDNAKFSLARELYSAVPAILESIPEGVDPDVDIEKEDLLRLAGQKIEDSKIAEQQYNARQAELAAQPAQPAGGQPAAAQPQQPAQGTNPTNPMMPMMPMMPGMGGQQGGMNPMMPMMPNMMPPAAPGG